MIGLIAHFYYFFFAKLSIKELFYKKRIEYVPIWISFVAFIIHSIFAGHAMMAPLPGIYIAALIALIKFDYY